MFEKFLVLVERVLRKLLGEPPSRISQPQQQAVQPTKKKWWARLKRKTKTAFKFLAFFLFLVAITLLGGPVATIAVLAVLSLLFGIAFVGLPWLAEENVLVTKVQEGTAKAIMRGNSFYRFVMSFEAHHLNDPTRPWYNPRIADWEVVDHPKTDDLEYDDRSWLFRHLGLYWVGWPWANSVYIYEFEWNETYTDPNDGTEKIRPRHEKTEFIFVSDFTYAIVTDRAETSDLLQTNSMTLVTIAVTNPYGALFKGENWMRRITAAINRHAKEFIGQRAYDEMVRVKKDDRTEYSRPIIELTSKLPDDTTAEGPQGLKNRYGITIRTADLQTFDLSGDQRQKNDAAAAKVFEAKQTREATILVAQGDAQRITLLGDAEAGSLEKRLATIAKYGDAGVSVAKFDALQEASKNPGTQTVWADSLTAAIAGALRPNNPPPQPQPQPQSNPQGGTST